VVVRLEVPGKPLRGIGASNSAGQFYEAYFGAPGPKRLIQVGANDGVMCDPLRRFLARAAPEALRALLIEPVPFYFERLKALYSERPDIAVLNAACGAAPGSAPLYYIDPAIADEMNGDGPANDWAHGQGSFDRDVIAYWIEQNRFRGETYVKNIARYHAAIRSVEVAIVRLGDLPLARDHANLLVVIDVQGFELEVIRGIDWEHPPAYVVFEDDLRRGAPIDAELRARGYSYLCGRNDKVYARG